VRILGVDPGSRLTGYGCLEKRGSQLILGRHGTLKLLPAAQKPPTCDTLAKDGVTSEAQLFSERIILLHEGLSEVISDFKPHVLVVERVFFAKNVLSALKLGQIRGAIILTGRIHSVEIAEYSPTEVKRIVVGHGQADKDQVAKMIQFLLGQQTFSTPDASDAVGLALCHAFFSPQLSGGALKSGLNQRSKKRFSMAESINVDRRLTKKD
jgi:crossover junction endodeoxyribonuclease RuvC